MFSFEETLYDLLKAEHSKSQTIKVVKLIGSDHKKFNSLLKLFLKNEFQISQRASAAVTLCIENHPSLIKDHLEKIIDNLANDVHDAVKRNTVRSLQFIDIPEKYLGKVADYCLNFLNSADEPIGVKAFALTVLENICRKEPDLAAEVLLILEVQRPYLGPAIRVREKRFMENLNLRKVK